MTKASYEITIYGTKENLLDFKGLIFGDYKIISFDHNRTIESKEKWFLTYRYLEKEQKNKVKKYLDKWLKEKKIYEYKIRNTNKW